MAVPSPDRMPFDADLGLAPLHWTRLEGDLDDPRWWILVAATLLLAASAWALRRAARSWHARSRRERALVLASAVAPALLTAGVLSLPYGDPFHAEAFVSPPVLFVGVFWATLMAPRPWAAALAFFFGLTALALYEVAALFGAMPNGGDERPSGTFLFVSIFFVPIVLVAAMIRTPRLWGRGRGAEAPPPAEDGT